jgi:hypothetical protein
MSTGFDGSAAWRSIDKNVDPETIYAAVNERGLPRKIWLATPTVRAVYYVY